ncbi:beta-galactosidase [Flavobacterium gilvum]|uniref:beta-galactosidase n=1 Tax=Flavobacterium gilvum TaxID=1492737 RepID=A0AAC9N774_9FLAO|nr:beta-galactosidase [Flavobacterium gilvum]AOW09973.1 beta-galactosidase [Flavobacterium gilvum]KFC58530.1 beta-galactosidase [Flavobacterium gilvum]
MRHHSILTLIFFLVFLNQFSYSQELFVGTNYHPHDDKNPEKIKKDIALMKAAGFKLVRLGHLAWDSYEPTEGKFDFLWFDGVMDEMNKAGIKVILDIAIRPAPLWLRQKFPSINISDASGNVLYPYRRYMEDVGDPNYQEYAVRFTDVITKRYAKHPALVAFGIDNESGSGPISYSETVRQRFIVWLQKKYKTLEALNKAWAGQRWSRKVSNFDQIGLSVTAAPERMLDFRCFVSDEVNICLTKVLNKVHENAPKALTNTNAWYYAPGKHFDYANIAYSGTMTREGCGFYPGNSLVNNAGLKEALFGISRIQYEATTPFWCNEFTSMTSIPNSIRKSAYATLMLGNQLVCAWTWQSMHAGEEQYLQGLVDWDGETNRKYDEYKKIATEFKKIEKYGFPYKPKAEIGMAFDFASQMVSSAYPEKHEAQLETCFNLFFDYNMDTRVLDIANSDLKYKILMVPGVAVMEPVKAKKIRDFVKNGGTVIMTAYSAVVDSTNQVFSETQPGLLSDVFGIRRASYEETESMNELSRIGLKGKAIRLNYKDKIIDTESERFDVIQIKGAEILGNITSIDKDYPIITSNQYGKGRAIYIGLPARQAVLSPIADDLIATLGIKKGPEVPKNVMARYIDNKHILYLNLTNEVQSINIKGYARSILYDQKYNGKFTIAPFEPEFIELE